MTERHDPYRGLARHYDLHRCDWYAGIYGPRLLKLLQDRGRETGTVLDAGCGTGTLALLLAGEGYTVTGMDLSAPMLEMARGKAGGDRVEWHQGDVTRLDIPGGPFDVVTCVGDTLNHLQTLEDWELAFRGFARHLKPGGLLFFDVMTLAGLERMDQYSVTDLPDRALLLGFIFEPATGRSTMKLTSFVRPPGSESFERASETVTEWGHPVARILERVEAAGFATVERVWPERDNPEQAERLSVTAVRR